jgi:hypothetical protein
MIQFVYFLAFASLFTSLPGLIYTIFRFKKIPLFRESFLILFIEQSSLAFAAYFMATFFFDLHTKNQFELL